MVGFGEKHEKIHRDVEILAPMSPEIGYIWFLHVENREAFVSPSSDIVPFFMLGVYPTFPHCLGPGNAVTGSRT